MIPTWLTCYSLSQVESDEHKRTDYEIKGQTSALWNKSLSETAYQSLDIGIRGQRLKRTSASGERQCSSKDERLTKSEDNVYTISMSHQYNDGNGVQFDNTMFSNPDLKTTCISHHVPKRGNEGLDHCVLFLQAISS